jgi:hypothetical protein
VAEGDINVIFAADTSQLDAAISGIKSKTQSLGAGAPGSGILTALPAGLGGPPKPPGGGSRVLTDEEREAARAANELKESQNEVAKAQESVGRSGINVAAMVERMAVRMAVLGTVFEAIRLATDAFKESVNFEKISVQFENLTSDTQAWSSDLKELQAQATAIGASTDEWAAVDEKLQRAGMSAAAAKTETETLGKYAQESGVNVSHLADEMARLRISRGTIEDMQELAQLSGRADLKERVDALQQEQIIRPRILEAQERQYQLQDRAYELQQRTNSAQQAFAEKIGLRPPGMEGVEPVKGVNFEVISGAMTAQMQIGEARLAQEEGITAETVKQLEIYGKITASDLLAAFNRQTEEQHLAVTQARQDQQYNQKIALEKEDLRLQHDVYNAINAQTGLQNRLANQQATAGAALDRAGSAIREMVDNSKDLLRIATEWATTIEKGVNLFKGGPHGEPSQAHKFLYETMSDENILKGAGNFFRGMFQSMMPNEPRTAADVARENKATQDHAARTAKATEEMAGLLQGLFSGT